MFRVLFALALTSPAALAADGHFTLPTGPSTPAGNGVGTFAGDLDSAPDGCDANRLLTWMRNWRQRAREGYVNGVAGKQPPLQSGMSCIKSESTTDVQYIANGDYWAVTCVAQKDGLVTSLWEWDIGANVDQNCLSDKVFNDYVKGTQCKMPGGNQLFLQQVMEPCQGGAVLKSTRIGAIDNIGKLNQLFKDKPSMTDIVDQTTGRVKGSHRTDNDPGPSRHRGNDSDACAIFDCSKGVPGN